MPKKRKISNKRYQNSYETRDQGGVSKKSFIDWKGKTVKFFTPVIGKNKINIIPFEVKSKNHPLVKTKKIGIGDLDFCFDLFVHRDVGPNKLKAVCPKKNYGKPCPICDLSSEYYEKGDMDAGKALKAQKRSLLNVQPIVDGKAEDLHVYDISHFRFTKELIEEANECGDGEDILNFADIDEGKIVTFRAEQNPEFKNDLILKSFKFVERKEELDEALIDEAISFDELIDVLSSEALEKMMYGADDDEEEIEADGDEEEPEKEAPKKEKKKKEDPEDDEEDESESKEKKEKSGSKDKCPHGHKFGTETDKHKECSKCDLWDDCDDA